ncbi:hypothetical protein GLAREA_07338 [Glarea lozoyensis ATCC 20868]|uniref:Uncharacterized protein n=1 Tax=Glarea lozoyensis (strain ATCC 20868 / MF5171) TaxID=1116229 RepID=S3D325_GLAL2|nr:uncharacterized protein GLAREA_07338 [Glarea lozoyensis ATCC 20868]EPE32205.1 hypothetical protein GLAREA_07338 [Glarea lozoyensis ATCC 20868]
MEGPLIAIQRLLPKVSWHIENYDVPFPLSGGHELAKLAFREIYQRDVRADIVGGMIVRDEYTGWLVEARPDMYVTPEIPCLSSRAESLNQDSFDFSMIDYYGITFDHLVPPGDPDPEVLQLNTFEIEDDGGIYANTYSRLKIDPPDYIGKKVLALPRCCQTRNGTTDRRRVNEGVMRRDGIEIEEEAKIEVRG